MDAIYSAQDVFKNDHNLSKIEIIHNQNYMPHGTKSYVHLLRKYNFEPTKEGPYFRADHPQHGPISGKLKTALSSRPSKGQVLVKRANPDPTTKHDEVTAEDSQNDTLYLSKVSIGKPHQTLMLDFDTGSADLWVFSKALSSSQKKGHNVFNPKASSSFKPLPGKT